MPKQPDERFPIPQPQAFTEPVLDLLGGVARPRPLSGEEAIRRLNEMEARARAGDPESQAELARRLLTEAPNARKNRRALILLRHAAAAGSATGLHLLALLHLRGQGLSQDLTKGVELLESAAYRGSKAAQADLAHALLNGIGTCVNTAKALYWLRLAAAQGDEQSALEAARILRDGESPSVHSENKQTLNESTALSPQNTHQAIFNTDHRQAEKYFTEAAKAGIPEAQYELAELLRRREVSERDPAAARKWMREAAFSGIVDAQFRIGVANWSGIGGKVDQREAVRWLCRAAEGGSAKAAAMLAGFLMTGNGLAYSPARAWALFMRAAKMGNENAAATAKILERQLPLQEKRVQRSLLRIKDSKTFLEKLIPRSER